MKLKHKIFTLIGLLALKEWYDRRNFNKGISYEKSKNNEKLLKRVEKAKKNPIKLTPTIRKRMRKKYNRTTK